MSVLLLIQMLFFIFYLKYLDELSFIIIMLYSLNVFFFNLTINQILYDQFCYLYNENYLFISFKFTINHHIYHNFYLII